MGSLSALSTDEVVERVLGDGALGHGDVRDRLDEAHRAAWAATSTRLLELCRVRIATMLGCGAEAAARTSDTTGTGGDPGDDPGGDPGDDVDALLPAIASWPTDPRFTASDRAALAFTEHYVIDVASVDDATVAALREHLGDEGVQNFVSALLVVEQRIRLRLMWDRLLGDR